MQIYVVTLDHATKRQLNIKRQFGAAGLAFTFFYGVDGNKGHHPLFDLYNESKRLGVKGEPLSLGQLGCFASHYQLWQRCVETAEPMVIIEDDAIIDADRMHTFLEAAPALPGRFECVRLFRNKSRVKKGLDPTFLAGDLYVKKFLKGHMSTVGYYLAPSGARKLLEHAQEWILPVDIFIDQFWNHGVECYGVEPPCLTNDEQLNSMINPGRKKSRRTPGSRLRRECYTLLQNSLRTWANLRFRFKR